MANVRRNIPNARGWVALPDGTWREETDEEFAAYLTGNVDVATAAGGALEELGSIYGIKRSPTDDAAPADWRNYRVLDLLDPVGIGLSDETVATIKRGLN